jgi:predicted nucleic acid-binding protein
VHSFEDATIPCPASIVLDTSFVVEALIPTRRLHDAARQYLGRLYSAGTTIYFNRLLELELAEAAFRLALRERFGRKAVAQYRRDGRARRRAAKLMANTILGWELTLLLFESACVEPHEVRAAVPELMRRYGLASYDAVHVATAVFVDTSAMLTTDVGFSAVPASLLTIYTDASRVAECRRRRARASVTN